MSNAKGSIGQALIVAHLLESGYNVLLPVADGLPYDLVVERDGSFKRVQCKYRTAENGTIKVPKKNNDHRGVGTTIYSEDNIDGFAVFCPDTRQVYYVPIATLVGVRKHLCLRIMPPRNNQTSRVHSASDFLSPECFFQRSEEHEPCSSD